LLLTIYAVIYNATMNRNNRDCCEWLRPLVLQPCNEIVELKRKCEWRVIYSILIKFYNNFYSSLFYNNLINVTKNKLYYLIRKINNRIKNHNFAKNYKFVIFEYFLSCLLALILSWENQMLSSDIIEFIIELSFFLILFLAFIR